MGNGVNVKMGVSGISQFKQNMQTARNSLKTVDEQLKLNEKQFKATGDAESYMQQKSELLKTKLEEQKAVVEQAEKAIQHMTSNGVEKSSKAFQDMQQQLARAQGELLDTSMQLQGIETASDNATAGLTDMSNQLNSIGDQVSLKTVADGIDSITEKMKNAAAKAWQMGEALVRATLGAGAWADELITKAAQYQVTPEELQRMQKVAGLIDTEVEAIVSSRQKLSTTLQSTSEDTAAIFARLGVQTQRYGEIRNLTDVFWETGEALMKIENEADRNAMGKKLFGDWKQLIPLFTAGREEYEKLMQEQSVVSADALDRLGSLDDQYQKFQSEMETLKMEILSGFAGPLEEAMKVLTDLMAEFNEYLKTPEGKAMLESMENAVSGLFSDLSKIDPNQVMEGFKGVFDQIINGFKWLDDNSQTVVTAMETIVGGWAALKITGGVLKILEVFAALKWIKLNPTIPTPTLTGGGSAAAAAASGGGAATSGTSAAAGAAAGGWFTGANNWMTGLASRAGAALTGLGNLLPVVGDIFMNQTNAGRALRDNEGVSGAIEGLKEDVTEKVEEITENVESFSEDWSNLAETAQNAFVEALTPYLNKPTKFTPEERSLAEQIYDNWYDDDYAVELMEQLEDLMGKDRYKVFEDKIYELMQRGLYFGADLPTEFFDEVEEQLPDEAEVIGENAAVGMANGIDARASEAIAAADALAQAVRDTLANALQIASPSRVMMRMGEFVSEGFAEGIEDGLARVNGAVYAMAGAATAMPARSAGSGRMVDVTLMIGPEKLTEVIVPLVDNSMGEEINLMRR